MSIPTAHTCKVLHQSTDSIFFEKPKMVQIDEEAVTNYSKSQNIDTLIKELKEKGVLVGIGQHGPQAYLKAPYQLQNIFHGKKIHAWKQGEARKEYAKSSYFLVLGARKIDNNQELVYFTLSYDKTLNTTSFIRNHEPSIIDDKIYVVSHKTFRNYLTDLYPPAILDFEKKYIAKIGLLPLDSILDRGEVEAKCKAIGQKAFNKAKERAHGDSCEAGKVVVKICDLIPSSFQDGKLRKSYVVKAWDNIGDKTWQWLS